MGFLQLLTEKMLVMWESLVKALPQFVVAILIICLTWFAARTLRSVADRVFKRAKMRASLRELLKTLIGLAVWTMGVLISF